MMMWFDGKLRHQVYKMNLHVRKVEHYLLSCSLVNSWTFWIFMGATFDFLPRRGTLDAGESWGAELDITGKEGTAWDAWLASPTWLWFLSETFHVFPVTDFFKFKTTLSSLPDRCAGLSGNTSILSAELSTFHSLPLCRFNISFIGLPGMILSSGSWLLILSKSIGQVKY